MKKQNTRFILAKATLDEVNRQLRINTFGSILLLLMLSMNVIRLIREHSLLYGVLSVIMALLLLVIIKSRKLLRVRQQQLLQ